MAPRLALSACLFGIATAQAATSAFWTYTSRFADQVSPSPYTRYNGAVTTYMSTMHRTVKSTVTPTATPTSTSTYYQSYNNVQGVYMYYATGAVAESDLMPERTYDYSATTMSTPSATTSTYIYFSMPVIMTAPASCPTPFTITTTASISVPSEVTGQVTPTSIKDGTTSTGIYGNVYYIQTWYLSDGAAPFKTTADYYYRSYVASCSTPPTEYTGRTRTAPSTTYTGSPRSGGSGNNGSTRSSRNRYCYYSSYYCGTPLVIWIIVIASVIPSLFLLGFLESWFWFRRLMLGKSAMRFGTICWVIISLWVLCFTRMQDRRSPEDRKVLAEKWKTMSSGAAFKAWWKWGFRHAYPVEHLGQFSRQTVGIVPAGQPLHPAMAQAPFGFPPGGPGQPGQVFYYGPPPPGWVQAPNGGFVPPQGYTFPPPDQAAGYYGDVMKDGSVVNSPPGPPQQPAYPMPPQAPQPVYTQPNVAQTPAVSPLPHASLPPLPPRPQAPVSPVSEVSSLQKPQALNNPPNPLPLKNDPNDRSLYE
ncbi:uncharacterized protein K460DRAFT_330544 [Cucurbitaria berberidis CBS 394.84]|uniref:Uncharacterized protein n=1 Tax=Cucurbitaria berberidis CBS 394.84 TaxID=1168544 RepID=A0A9P4GNP7_9PLEO|nr:uncharacterized protein K460DRAFT_330544 [Cucurbitaria berberidis CBS 394.84]KAF1849017.1 hypothetical protein K460DRAFT_330544 [Cucurbitaria berberidis CBS 394.84]